MSLHRSHQALPVALAVVLFVGVALPITAQKGGGASPAQSAGSQQGAQGGATPYFETEMEAYGAVNQLSESIAGQVCHDLANTSATVVIFDPASFQNVVAWQSFSATATALKAAYESLLTQGEVDGLFPPPAAGAPPAGPFNRMATIPVTSASDLAGLITALASSTTNSASTFTIQDSTMAVSLAHQFQRFQNAKKCNVDVKYYPLFGSYVDLTDYNRAVLDAFGDLNKLRRYIQHSNTFTTGSTDPKYLLFYDLNSQYDSLLKSISGLSQNQGGQQQGGGQNTPANGPANGAPTSAPSSGAGLMSLAQGAALNKLLTQDTTFVLYADVVAAGGTQRDRKNIFTLITGDWISYSGGVIVNVALIHSADTSLALADTLRYRTGYAHHISDPREGESIENTNAGENEPSLCGQERRLHWWQWQKYVPNPCPNNQVPQVPQANGSP